MAEIRIKLLILLFAFFLIILPAVSAATYIYTKDTTIDLKVFCFDGNNSYCSNTTNCNITVLYPNSSAFINNQQMTYNANFYNLTILNSRTETIGEYFAIPNCISGTNVSGVSTYTFKITPNGSELSVSQGILYLVFLIAAIGLFLLCLIYSIKIPWSHQKDEEGYVIGINDMRYVKLFLVVMCYIILMFSLGLLRGITANYLPEIGVSGFFEWGFWIMLSLMYPLIVCSLIFAVIIFISNKKFQKALEKGLPTK